ncbi:hypothetical protein B0H12DRAFT_595488 [Mycena haematopus]|nr:hypothetical protein B0H12DRAFT_601681 [Mycena haematopus]KAJ7253354.1 hypothetical protein B0H12DRAFT_595488 [Mycena haematopus]
MPSQSNVHPNLGRSRPSTEKYPPRQCRRATAIRGERTPAAALTLGPREPPLDENPTAEPPPLHCTHGATTLVPTPSCLYAPSPSPSPSSHMPHCSHTRATHDANAAPQPSPPFRTCAAPVAVLHPRSHHPRLPHHVRAPSLHSHPLHRCFCSRPSQPRPLSCPPPRSRCGRRARCEHERVRPRVKSKHQAQSLCCARATNRHDADAPCYFGPRPRAADMGAAARCKHERPGPCDAGTNAKLPCYALRNAGGMRIPLLFSRPPPRRRCGYSPMMLEPLHRACHLECPCATPPSAANTNTHPE